MFGKVVIFVLALAVCGYGQSCLQVTGTCVLGQCPTGQSCLSNICCITDVGHLCNNTLGDTFCDSNLNKCNDPQVGGSLQKACPRTCGTCAAAGASTVSPVVATTVSPGGASCVDKVNPSTGVSDCPKDAYLCNNPAYYDLMTQQCPKTCGRCSSTPTSSSTCVDKVNPSTGVSDCPKDAYLCNNPSYYTLMTQQCPKTCGRC
uniref:ShKT domain-containing protein n=1 Tax=Panagrolaimus sp. JU765 TaxID=591449 RepID=A0AC34QEK0_9BILA